MIRLVAPAKLLAWGGVVALVACGGPQAASTRESPAQRPERHVVLISIDGLRADWLGNASVRAPTLRALAAAGAIAEGMTSVWPTVTYPAHATLVTGVRPARHGILNNGPFDPLRKNQEGWSWYASELRAKPLWDTAHAAGVTTANVYWPVTVGAAIDWSIPQIWRAKNDEDDKLLDALSTPGLMAAIRARYGRTPAEHRSDAERAEAAEYILESKRPGLALVYLTDLDTVQHASGPFSAPALATLEAIDRYVARLIRATERAHTRETTTFVVVSDHGFLPITKVTKPGVLLHAAGLLDVDASGAPTAWRAAAWKSGGTCAIMLRDPNDVALRETVRRLFEEAAKSPESGIAKVHEGSAIAARGGFPGVAFVLEAQDGFAFSQSLDAPVVSETAERGVHGYPPDRPEMRATLILSGAGIVPGAKLPVVDMVDVAPTIAKLLALSMPAVEGHVLDAALAR